MAGLLRPLKASERMSDGENGHWVRSGERDRADDSRRYSAVPQMYLKRRGTVAEITNVFERVVKCIENGGPCWIRTSDHLIKSQRLTV